MDDYYQILGVSRTASSEEIKKRYFFLAKAYHPDRFSDDASKSEALKEMQKINQAYEVLSNSEKRRRYDQGSREDSPPSSYQATNNHGTSENNNSVLFDYLVSLVEKWRVQIEFPLPDGQLENIRREFTYSVIYFFTDIYQQAGADKILEETKRTNEAVFMLVQINIALGMQNRHGGFENNFTLEELTKASTLPVRSVLSNAIKHLSVQKKDITPQKRGEIASVAQNSLTLCRLVQARAELFYKPNRSQQENNKYTAPQNETRRGLNYCQACGTNYPTKNVTFRLNIGLLIMRVNRTVAGNLCAYCIEKYFWEYTAITLFFGWWGIISFFTTPFILLLNLFNYLKTLNLKPNKIALWRIAWAAKAFILLAVLIIGWFSGNYFLQTLFPNFGPVSAPVYIAPTQVPLQTQFPIILPSATIPAPTRTPVYYNGQKCYKWDKITIDMSSIKTDVCVYGIIVDAYWQGKNKDTYVMVFNEYSKTSNKGFRLMTFDRLYFPDIVGECVVVSGKIELFDGAPYIVPDNPIEYFPVVSTCY